MLLIVDDDKFFLKLLTKIFANHYEVVTADSGEAAIKLLADKLVPGVILSDQIMPGITGTEFLKKSIDYVPLSTRLIITANNDPKSIIESINTAHAFMYLTKPVEELQIVQAIKIAFDHHTSKSTSQKAITDLNLKIDELKNSNSKIAVQSTSSKIPVVLRQCRSFRLCLNNADNFLLYKSYWVRYKYINCTLEGSCYRNRKHT